MNEKKFEKEFAFDLHVHTRCLRKSVYQSLSDGVNTAGEIVRFAKHIGLSGLAVTDHNTTIGIEAAMTEGKSKGILVIPGCELSTTDRTELLVYGLDNIRGLTGTTTEIIKAVHDKGGIAVKAHPLFSAIKDLKNPFNNSDTFDAFEINSVIPLFVNEFFKEVSMRRGIKLTGGSDSHSYLTLGNAITLFRNEITDADSLIEALRKGRMEAKQFSSDYHLRVQVYPQQLKLLFGRKSNSPVPSKKSEIIE